MTRLVSLPLLFLALVVTACSSIETSYDYDLQADFGALKSYAWIDPPQGESANELSYRRVVSSTDEVLAQKGFRLDPSAPDFLVAAHLGTESQLSVTDWGYGYRRGPGSYGAREIEVNEYDVGTLVLDVVQAATKELLWRGTAQGTIDPGAKPEERTKRIQAAVEELLSQFPPTAAR